MVISCSTFQKEEKEYIWVKYLIYHVLSQFQIWRNICIPKISEFTKKMFFSKSVHPFLILFPFPFLLILLPFLFLLLLLLLIFLIFLLSCSSYLSLTSCFSSSTCLLFLLLLLILPPIPTSPPLLASPPLPTSPPLHVFPPQKWKNVWACKQCLCNFFLAQVKAVLNFTLFCRKN